MFTDYLKLLMEKPSLDVAEAEAAMTLLLDDADPHQIAAFLALQKYRGETSDEIAGMVAALQKRAVPVQLPFPALDIVGTGGDLAHTVNISTGSAILAAACGIPIAKHGNRSVSSRSGSADVLEALGVNIEIPPERAPHCIREAGIAFLFAPLYHPALKKLSPIRRGLKLPTVFNLLGPLLNPAKPEYALIGVAQESALQIMGEAILKDPSKKRTLLFHGNGLDELTPLGKTTAYDIRDGKMQRLEIDPAALGLARCSLQDLQGGDATLNASILMRAFEDVPSAVADTLILNAGAALFIFGHAATLSAGVERARSVLVQGKALTVLQKLIEFGGYRE